MAINITPFGLGGLSSASKTYGLLKPKTEEEKELERLEKEELDGIDKERKGLGHAVLNALQTGQYVTANIAEDFSRLLRGEKDAFDAPVRKALNWERKGDWEDVLFGGKSEGSREQRGIFKTDNKPARAVGGLIANILFDPTTYIGFGSTAAARAAAKDYAEEAVRVSLKRATSAKDNVDIHKLGKSALGPDAHLRDVDKTYREAYREALRMPPEKLNRELLMRKKGDVPQKGNLQGSLREELNQGGFSQKYAHAGERGFSFMGMPVKSTVTQQERGFIGKQFEQIGDAIRQNPTVEKFSDAWWAKMNTGRIGQLRRIFGFRNPYQRALNEINLSKNAHVREFMADETAIPQEIFAGYTPEQKQGWFKAFQFAEKIGGEGGSMKDVLLNPYFRSQLSPDVPDDVILDITSRVNEMNDRWANIETEWAVGGFMIPEKNRKYYIPAYATDTNKFKQGKLRGTGAPSFVHAKEHDFLSKMELEASRLKNMLGISDKEAMSMVRRGESLLVTDPEEIFTIRAIQHAKMRGRVELITKLREFGVKIRDINPPIGANPQVRELWKQLENTGEGLEEIGLYQIPNDPATKGWLFDKEVHEILERSILVTEPNESLFQLRRLMNRTTDYWRAVVTTNPPFHIRNATSNQFLLFLRAGAAAFDPKMIQNGAAGATNLFGADSAFAKDVSAKLLGGETGVNRILNREIQGVQIREWAKYSKREGIISPYAHVGDPMREGGSRVNPFSLSFAPFKWSQETGSYIESSQRFQLFLHELKKMGGGTNRQLRAHEIEAAKFEAKKWMLDYSDLTDFERSWMRGTFPFYSWVRKIVPLMLQAIVETPHLVGVSAKFANALQSGTEQPGVVPDWMADSGLVAINKSEDPFSHFMFDPNNPIHELNILPVMFQNGDPDQPGLKGPPEAISDILEKAHPILRTIAETATGRDVWSQRDLTEGQTKAPAVLQWIKGSPTMLKLLDGVARTWDPAEGLKLGFDQNDKLVMDPVVANILEENLPLLKSMERALEGPTWVKDALASNISESMSGTGGGRSSQDNLQSFMQAMRWFTGLGVYRYDEGVEQQARKRNNRRSGSKYTRMDDRYSGGGTRLQ